MTGRPPGPLTGKTAFVSGSTGVVGRQVCRVLADAGARLVMQYHNTEPDTAYGETDGHRAVAIDFTFREWQEAVSSAIDSVGGIDILVSAAHPAHGDGTVGELEADTLARHLHGTVVHAELVGAMLPHMRRNGWGRVVFVAGALMSRPHPGKGAYGAAKAAGAVLTRYVALEEGRHGITANIVAPSRIIDTDADEPVLSEEMQAFSDQLLARTALGVFPTSQEVADAVYGLVLPTAGAITGQTVWITGGEPIA